MPKQKSLMQIRGLELYVNLGWPEKERQQQQAVLMDLSIHFAEPPKACISDNLSDTLCYSDLIDSIRNNISNKNFHLIEHLGHEIYHVIKTKLPDNVCINLNITKHPVISGLTGGVSFSLFDG